MLVHCNYELSTRNYITEAIISCMEVAIYSVKINITTRSNSSPICP